MVGEAGGLSSAKRGGPSPEPPAAPPGDNPLQTFLSSTLSSPLQQNTYRGCSRPRRETTSEVFLAFQAGENFPSLSNSCLRMENTAHSFILRHENLPIHGNTCLTMEKLAVFFILRQLLLRDGKFSPAGKAWKTSEVISRRGPRITSLSVLFAGGWKRCWKEKFGAGYLPSRSRSSGGGSCFCPRITLQPPSYTSI